MSKPYLVSALPPLSPSMIINTSTGEIIETEEYRQSLKSLVSYVQEQSQLLWRLHKNTLQQTLTNITAKSPAEVGRQAGLSINTSELPRDIKAKSRIERLIRYQVITSAKSYYENPNKLKQEPSFSPYLNLGAIDNQMANLVLEDGIITLTMKCWDKEYALTFRLPEYVINRNLTKLTLPVIKQMGEEWVFLFSTHELPQQRELVEEYIAGIDLGRVEPFTLVITHASTRKRVAQFTASKRLRILIHKRDRIINELKYLYAKSLAYNSLGIANTTLELERVRTRDKRNRLNNKITWLIATEIQQAVVHYSPRVINMEDLSWVTGAKYGSRWSHSKDQSAITHKLTRMGLVVKRVNPRDTSQDCHKCGNKVTHRTGKRLIVCSNCVMVIDRDLNAAMNIALRPLPKRSQGNNCTVSTEVMLVTNQPVKRLLTRNTS